MIGLGRIAYTLVFLFIGEIAPVSDPPSANSLPVNEATPILQQQVDTTVIKRCGLNFRVFDFSCTASNNFTIAATGLPGIQLGQDIVLEQVRLIIDHDWVADLDIFLRSPNGVWVEISTDNGGASNDFGDPTDLSCERLSTFSMSACTSVQAAEGPFLGEFIPEGNLNDFNDSSNPNGDWVLQLCDDALGDEGTLKGVELVFTNQILRPVTSLAIDTIANTFIEINWTSNNTACAQTYIEYGPPGFAPGTGATAGEGILATLNCPVSQPYRLNGLSEFTSYDLYLRETDGNGNFTDNSCALTFTTECSTEPISLQESFDTQTDCGQDCGTSCDLSGVWKNKSDDDFDWLINSGETPTSETGPSDDISQGGQYIYVETSRRACRNRAAAVLESNCLEVVANSGECHMSFYYHFYGPDINSLSLEITTDNGLNWNSLWSDSGDKGDQWIKQYIDLSAYDGQVVRMRFIGLGGNGRRGDLALDEIRLYGTNDLGDQPFVFYADVDGDGFGNVNSPIASCNNVVPDGAVVDSTDCDDDNGSIYPGAPEILCNQIDENCNGPADDQVLNDPIVPIQFVCKGENLTINLSSAFGSYYWFDAPDASSPIHIGNAFTVPQTDSSSNFYVLDSLPPNCSSERVLVQVGVNEVPDLIVNTPEPICLGDQVDLAILGVVDLNNLSGNLTYHSATPTSSANELSSSVVQPGSSTTYYIKKTSNTGCSAEISVTINVFPAPEVQLSPGNNVPLCPGDIATITANPDQNTFPPVSFRWSNSTRGPNLEVQAGAPGQQDTYSVTITDGRGCTSIENVVVETTNSVSSVRVNLIEDVSICNGNDGSITLEPLDGTGPFAYQWDGPVSGSSNNLIGPYRIPNLEQGTYRVTVTDLAPPSCDFILPILVVNGPAVVIDPNVVIQQESCFGSQDGGVDLTVFANNPSFLWSNNATTEDLSGVGAGTYSVTITDSGCSVTLEDLVIQSPPALEAEIFDLALASCSANTDGNIDITVTGGAPPYTYIWSNNATTPDLPNIPAGVYSVTINDENGCEVILDQIQLENQDPIVITPFEVRSPLCAGEDNALIRVEVSGGIPPYTYQWNFSGQGPILAGITAGVYTLDLIDAAGCVETFTQLIEDQLPLSIAQQTLNPPTCNGLSDGSIELEASGGVPPYTYLWSDGETGSIRTQLEAGTYTCEIVDFNNCSYSVDPINLDAPVSLVLTGIFTQGASCFGVDDGFIDIDLTGGTAPYNYQWSHGDTIQDPNGLAAGFYDVTITDQNGCLMEIPDIEVVQFNPLGVIVELAADPSCGDSEDGLIELRTESLAFPVSYNWNTGDTTEDLRNLPKGDYSCTITDAMGCIHILDTITLIAPEVLDVILIDTESPLCNGLPDGVAIIDIYGGVPPYSYLWSNGDTTKNLTGVEAGTYQLLVQDATGCFAASESVTIQEPNELNVEVVDIVPAGCQNDFGSIQVRPLGGTSPYHITWTTGDTTFRITDLSPGDYGLTLTDAQGCIRLQSSIEVFLTPEEFLIETGEILNVSCPGTNDGQIIPVPLGGQGPYQYNWSNSRLDSINNNLPPGIYELTMTDRNGCTGVLSDIEITTEASLQYQVIAVNDALCFGEASGSIELAIQGGTSPYNVTWTNMDTGVILDNLTTGRYSFTIIDDRGCELISNDEWIISEPNQLAIGQLLLDSASCAGIADGGVELNMTGGVEPYQFLWSTGDTTNYAQQLASDSTYSCTVLDANECELVINTIQVPGPDPLQNEFESVPARIGANDGQAAAIPSGGTPPYQYYWDFGFGTSTDSLVTDLPAGTYAFTLTDANFCILTDSVTVDERLSSSTSNIYQKLEMQVLPNPASQQQRINVFLVSNFSDEIDLQVIGLNGQLVFQKDARLIEETVISVDHPIPVGMYFVRVQLKNTGLVSVRKLIVID